MTTTSTKHRPLDVEPKLAVDGAKGSLLDDMEIVRKYCLPETATKKGPHASSISFGTAKEPVNSSNRSDFDQKSMADVEPDSTRKLRNRYMNSKHFELGFDSTPAVPESRAAFAAHSREKMLAKPVATIGGPNDKNASNVFSSGKERGDWVDDIESTNRVDFRPKYIAPNPANKEAVAMHRATHFALGTDPPEYKSHAAENYAGVPPMEPTKPIKAPPSAVQLGSPDYPWKDELATTNRADFAKPQMPEDDSLTAFVKQGPPMSFGTDPAEYRTEYRGQYKKTGFLDCTQLTDEQLLMLGVTREQLIPRKVQLPFLQGETFKNSLGQPIATG
eukprot:NODE_2009_length_1159_cov_48.802326_g1992_i0.p1 GENE.NODE_2009_length_1159_cov_48.802326_g1992_i0~~NODE_2009_length_1159_cov_48.802326_g1992_i0.p1  ORF type:complete len:332 (+),score=53.22 NODE_2009_length_1159_cov_48.802326_g1992_i0:96-1091(+)